ncbi:MAG: hypothetical protein A2Y94_15190 [Caldithrix sp. RBG_13_44_9]|nr:MAG: hypothetical protein A2Y94_15190 [Caldithrix sp. RBG_13_44_9]
MIRWYKIFGLMYLTVWLWVITGCENPTEYEFIPQMTLNAELRAGFPIDSVFVSWSADITERYDTDEQKVSGAQVTLNGVNLLEYPAAKGVYYYPDTNYRVQSEEVYEIKIRSGSDSISSVTIVPPSFQITPGEISDGDTVQYIPGTSFFSDEFFNVVWSGYQGSEIYRIISLADVATEANFIVDDRPEAEVFKGEEKDRKNPSIWWVADEYVRVNWMFFNWTGWHSIIVSAMDDNYYQYRNGILFGEQGGQNFNEVVRGGLGLFCSSASDTLRIYLVE